MIFPMKLNTEKIQKLMDERGLNKTALACKMGVKESWVYEVLSGRQGKTFNTVDKIAEALEVESKDLVTE